MGKVSDTIKTVNSTLRTLLAIVLVAGAGYGGYLTYSLYHAPQQQLREKQAELDEALAELTRMADDLTARKQEIVELHQQLEDKNAQIEHLELAIRLLKVRRRLARLKVLDQQIDDQRDLLVSRVEFVEVNDEGQPIGPLQQFDIQGEQVYVDSLLVTFDDRYVEQADLDRSTAICLFQRIFGEHQEAAGGFPLDRVGTRPTAYARGTEMSDFERNIWNDFWSIANDPQRATELGIHAAHGVAVSMRVEPETTYEIELRATGEMTFRPIDTASAPAEPAE